ncbi:uncharacterized protein PV06_07555 [Exophiala oligosperma]|uniref:Xylanolytic transcriptional activator regulatory domain-containing protein n=1 Tax=Exophiala oligosperma TaxID=215243 RepID=A0A0D2BSC1_9EURO|nr:uncharacterized protein PV06_07555 [Exophiala oligosperma]KIW40352.1 hypothetical protein PV06_07555 [Exophiala oligosperma]
MFQAHEAQSSQFQVTKHAPQTIQAEKVADGVLDHASDRISQSMGNDKGSTAPVPQLTRLIRDSRGKYMFIGDSANLAFLQNIRRLVEASIGTCAFTEDPLRHMMVEDIPQPQGQGHWLDSQRNEAVLKPTLEEATALIRQYMFTTNCVLDLFDESDLLAYLPQWIDGTSDQTDSYGSIYYLVLAIGAQTSAEDKDDLAEMYFNHGRYLTALLYMEEPSLLSVQSHVLIAMYMLGASRRNAAFMQLGTAARAAHALGLHKKDVADLFAESERRTRERTWKVLRVLDSFMSSSLGRPYSTSETRDTTKRENYSAAVNLCSIFEHIETEVYAKRMVSTEAVQRISKEHRYWTALFQQGLKEDGISPEERLPGGLPNIGLIHLKEAYYWSIILLTRPFLLDYVSVSIEEMRDSNTKTATHATRSSNQTLVDACVDSAVRSINLLTVLHNCKHVPKRLPFVVNSVFVAAMITGIAFFGNLDRSFPLKKALEDAQAALRLLSPHDTLAQRHLVIIEFLQAACHIYIERRDRQKMVGHRRAIGSIFGVLHEQQNISLASSSARPVMESTSTSSDPVAREIDNSGQKSLPGNQTDFKPYETTLQSTQFPGQSPWISEQNHGFTLTEGANDMPFGGFEAFSDQVLDFSPRTLWFDTYEENNPLWQLQGFLDSSNPADMPLPEL